MAGIKQSSFVGAWSLLLLSCGGGDATGPLSTAAPASLVIVSGDAQLGVVGTELSSPLVVKVTDANGAAVHGQIVNFKVVAGGGSTFAGAAITNNDGLAQDRWTLGTSVADSQKVEARAVDPATGAAIVFATFRATPSAGAAASIKKASADTIQVGVSANVFPAPRVQVVDKYGNPVKNAAVTFAVTAGGGSVSGASQITSDSGYATVGGWTAGTTSGTNTLSVSLQGSSVTPIAFTAISNVNTIQWTGATSTASVGATVDVTFHVADFKSANASGATVTFTPSDGGSSAASAVTGADGNVTAHWVLGPSPKQQTLTAKLADGSSTNASMKARAKLTIVNGSPENVDPGTYVSRDPTVQVQTLDGTPVSGAIVTFQASGDGQVSSAQVATASNGNAAARWRLGTTPGTTNTLSIVLGDSTVRLTSCALGPALSVTAALPAGDVTVGDVVAATVSAKDVCGVERAVTWSSSDPTIATVNSSGQVTAVGVGGPVTITASRDGKQGTATINWIGGVTVVLNSSVTAEDYLYVVDGGPIGSTPVWRLNGLPNMPEGGPYRVRVAALRYCATVMHLACLDWDRDVWASGSGKAQNVFVQRAQRTAISVDVVEPLVTINAPATVPPDTGLRALQSPSFPVSWSFSRDAGSLLGTSQPTLISQNSCTLWYTTGAFANAPGTENPAGVWNGSGTATLENASQCLSVRALVLPDITFTRRCNGCDGNTIANLTNHIYYLGPNPGVTVRKQ